MTDGVDDEGALVDADVRRRIANDLDATFLVEAAAGTGKTASLVERMVGLVATGVPAREIAAITFTRKAAAELRTRFQISLEKRLPREADPVIQDRLGIALSEIDRSYHGTIHSFCARMLRERPVEAGVSPAFREIEQDEASHINNAAWDEHVEQLHLSGSALVGELARIGTTFADLRPTHLVFCENLDLDYVFQPTPPPHLRESFEQVEAFVAWALPQMPPQPPQAGWDKLQLKLLTLPGRLRRTDPDSQVQVVAVLEELEGSINVTFNRWASDGRAVKNRLEDLQARVVAPALRSWREHTHSIVIRAVGDAPRRAQRKRIEAGALSFHDLLLLARNLLRDHSHVREYFQRRFTRILVDEFQDTDPVQTEILFYLTASDLDERDWRALQPRPGSLFIVGDPKQSIYRFRRADIALYRRVAERIEQTGGDVLPLTTNFRSTDQLCEWFNRVFTGIFNDTATEMQAAMALAHPRRVASLRRSVCRLSMQLQSWRPEDSDLEAEAARVASWIAAAVASKWSVDDEDGPRDAKWSDFLLIAWNRTRIQLYASALERHGVPYEITGGRGFAKADELRLLRPLLRAVVDPEDEVSIVAWLHGELGGGVDDEAMLRFVTSGGRFEYLREPPVGTDERIVLAFRGLRESWRDARTLPPGAALGSILDRVGVLPLAASLERGDSRTGTLLKAMTITRDCAARGMSFSEIIGHIEEHLDNSGQSEIEELSADPAKGDVVRLMNLHQAKGLEAPVVFLLDPRDLPRIDPDCFVQRDASPPRAHKVLHRPKGYFAKKILGIPSRWDELAAIEQQFEQAERCRLLYVAATRAKNLLVVSIAADNNGRLRGPWTPFSSFLHEELFDIPRSQSAILEPDTIDVSSEFAAFRRDLSDRRASILAPTYREETIVRIARRVPADDSLGAVNDASISAPLELKEVSAETALEPIVTPFERGPSWGRVLHRILEAAMRNQGIDVALMARNLLVEEGRDPSEKSDVVELIEGVRESDIWKRAVASPRCYVEVPFAFHTTSVSLGLEGPEVVLLRGAIDLVFEEEGRWILVDYKSDSTEGRLEALVEEYRPQVKLYAKYWADQTNAEVQPGLFFVNTKQQVWL